MFWIIEKFIVPIAFCVASYLAGWYACRYQYDRVMEWERQQLERAQEKLVIMLDTLAERG